MAAERFKHRRSRKSKRGWRSGLLHSEQRILPDERSQFDAALTIELSLEFQQERGDTP
jgi:hypothetical protein